MPALSEVLNACATQEERDALWAEFREAEEADIQCRFDAQQEENRQWRIHMHDVGRKVNAMATAPAAEALRLLDEVRDDLPTLVRWATPMDDEPW